MTEAIRKWSRLIMARSLTRMEMDGNFQFSHIWKLEIMFSQFNFARITFEMSQERKRKHLWKKNLFDSEVKVSFF